MAKLKKWYSCFFCFFIILLGLSLTHSSFALDHRERIGDGDHWQSDVFGPSALNSRGLEGCNKKPKGNNLCGACGGWGVFERFGEAQCPGCGLWCSTLPPRSELVAHKGAGSVFSEGFTIPHDAMISTISLVENCETGEIISETPVEVAVWNPSEVLFEFKPYGVSIDEESLNKLAGTHPAAAFLIGLRMERDGFVTAATDMHNSSSSNSVGEMTMEFALASIYAGPRGNLPPLDPLQEGQEFHYEFSSNINNQSPELVVRSWISDARDATIRDIVETTIALEKDPWHVAPVVASGGFLAPVYRVAGFRTSFR